ncbi:hypothetical protein TTHERM_000037589 (macronuclear) [Tetrahymena thermophila SB210]|uniref:Uncharacterized protein n=1 Tax=Tetrahymena thermophila (strain SB210) TaxID=312017 RepID=W7XC20_TETTS|nr:hypothetical protein TTHERM_000037589 [Tetrahymena thermophila SB210]EWS74902.1 hypothetical protein TTHERM_000037589 [Tetrahymena thermophila SB210]|eukprot:XP_012652615.1 hypothetical protein TTHERM_000037589 [Tetrahymena thermophila SB210]
MKKINDLLLNFYSLMLKFNRQLLKITRILLKQRIKKKKNTKLNMNKQQIRLILLLTKIPKTNLVVLKIMIRTTKLLFLKIKHQNLKFKLTSNKTNENIIIFNYIQKSKFQLDY